MISGAREGFSRLITAQTVGTFGASRAALSPYLLVPCLLAAGIMVLTSFGTSPAFANEAEDALAFELPGFNFSEDLKAVEKAPTVLPDEEFTRFVYDGFGPSAAPEFSFNMGASSLSGFLTLDHVEQDPLIASLQPGGGVIGDATLNWRLSESFALSTTVGRRLAETQELAAIGSIFEETLGGGVTYFVTPNFAMTAEGILAAPDFNLQTVDGLPGEAEASFIATWQFLPFFSGSVNYTYELRDPLLLQGQDSAESTVSFTLIGKF